MRMYKTQMNRLSVVNSGFQLETGSLTDFHKTHALQTQELMHKPHYVCTGSFAI